MIDPLSLPTALIVEYIARLTPRQLEIIGHIATGQTDKETSLLLSISPRTVRKRLSDARYRIGADNRIQLVAVFVAWKYLTSPEKSV